MKKENKQDIIIFNNKPYIILDKLKHEYEDSFGDYKSKEFLVTIENNKKTILCIEDLSEGGGNIHIRYIHPKSKIKGTKIIYLEHNGKSSFLELYYIDGDRLHREDGPAYPIDDDGNLVNEYWVNGEFCKTKEIYEKKLQKFLNKKNKKPKLFILNYKGHIK